MKYIFINNYQLWNLSIVSSSAVKLHEKVKSKIPEEGKENEDDEFDNDYGDEEEDRGYIDEDKPKF